MRFIGLDIHRDFCEVAISEGSKARSAGRVSTDRATLTIFGQSLASDDKVIVESTGNALEIARVLEPFVDEVVIANPMHVRDQPREGQERPVRRADPRGAPRRRSRPAGVDRR